MSKRKKPVRGVAASSPVEGATLPSPTQPRRLWRIAIPLLLTVTVIVVFANKPGRDPVPQAAPAPVSSHAEHAATAQPAGTPRLVDLGADKCIPCKAMAPILVELRTEYAGRLQVDFIDVWKNPGAGDPYNIYTIPTQIFFDGTGEELTRHEGFISKADILATWKRLGYDFSGAGVATPRS